MAADDLESKRRFRQAIAQNTRQRSVLERTGHPDIRPFHLRAIERKDVIAVRRKPVEHFCQSALSEIYRKGRFLLRHQGCRTSHEKQHTGNDTADMPFL